MPISRSFPRLVSAIALSAGLSLTGWGAQGVAAQGVGQSAGEGAGPYLAARLATTLNDYAAAQTFYQRLLNVMPGSNDVAEGALVSQLAVGDFDGARDLALPMASGNSPSQIAVLTALADAARTGDFAKGTALLARADGGELIAGLYNGWAFVGTGQMGDAAKAFDALGKKKGLAGFAAYHKALSLAMVGDFDGAETIFSGPYAGILHGTRRAVLAHVQILSQLERDPDALKLFDQTFGSGGTGLDPELTAIRKDLVDGKTIPFTVVRSAADGVAESFFTVGQALNTEGPSAFVLVHARLAQMVRPDFSDALLLSAAVLQAQEQYDLAIATYNGIKPSDPIYFAAQMGRAETLVASGHRPEAIDVLKALADKDPTQIPVWLTLGDNYRQEEDFKSAVTAYDKAISLVATPGPNDWFLFFARGIAEHKTDQWDKAEADFRKALELSPDQPSVLNYLGYSYVERRQDLDEALSMIKRAVAARPDAGYIVDSLGWAYYMLGHYDDAVVEMEKAVELDPGEPLLNDHLGDVLWAVGRKREAEFQWHRALNLGPGEDLDMDRVRRKLDIGLDAVLKEEGAPALQSGNVEN